MILGACPTNNGFYENNISRCLACDKNCKTCKGNIIFLL